MIDNSKITYQKSFDKKNNQITKFRHLIKFKTHDIFFNSKTISIKFSFFTSKAKLTFTKLKQTFIKALIHIFLIQNAIFKLKLTFPGI